MKRTIISATLALALVTLIAPFVGAQPCPARPFPNGGGNVYRCHYELVQPGMTYRAVRALVGFDGEEVSASSTVRMVRWVDTFQGPGTLSVIFHRAADGQWIVGTKSAYELRHPPLADGRPGFCENPAYKTWLSCQPEKKGTPR